MNVLKVSLDWQYLNLRPLLTSPNNIHLNIACILRQWLSQRRLYSVNKKCIAYLNLFDFVRIVCDLSVLSEFAWSLLRWSVKFPLPNHCFDSLLLIYANDIFVKLLPSLSRQLLGYVVYRLTEERFSSSERYISSTYTNLKILVTSRPSWPEVGRHTFCRLFRSSDSQM